MGCADPGDGSRVLIAYYGPRLIARPWLRTAVIVMFVAAFAAALVGGAFGHPEQDRSDFVTGRETLT